jgi:hypothetical protein
MYVTVNYITNCSKFVYEKATVPHDTPYTLYTYKQPHIKTHAFNLRNRDRNLL